MFFEKAATIEDLKPIAAKLTEGFADKRVFAFYGKMGAGKTTFIQALCRHLESDDNVISPTFALINEYQTKSAGSIYHFDFYRINHLSEAFDLGYEDYFYSGNYCFIEWPEKIESLLPEDTVTVKIETDNDENRFISAFEQANPQ